MDSRLQTRLWQVAKRLRARWLWRLICAQLILSALVGYVLVQLDRREIVELPFTAVQWWLGI